jgi:hypothetical protein
MVVAKAASRQHAAVRGDGIMTTFDEREKDFEARFKHDEELRFKVTARRNRLLGLWAAGHMELDAAAAEAYAKTIVATEFEPGGDQRVIAKIVADLEGKGQVFSPSQIRFELDHCAEEAKKQIMKE